MFFRARFKGRQLTTFTMHLTTFYQRKTTPKHPLFSKPPSKSPANNDKSNLRPPAGFFPNYGFFRIAFTAIALGELPAGSIVKRVGSAVPAVRMTATSPE